MAGLLPRPLGSDAPLQIPKAVSEVPTSDSLSVVAAFRASFLQTNGNDFKHFAPTSVGYASPTICTLFYRLNDDTPQVRMCLYHKPAQYAGKSQNRPSANASKLTGAGR